MRYQTLVFIALNCLRQLNVYSVFDCYTRRCEKDYRHTDEWTLAWGLSSVTRYENKRSMNAYYNNYYYVTGKT